MFEQRKNGVKKYQLFASVAQVGLEHRECSILKNAAVPLAEDDLPHQSPAAGAGSPCPGAFVSLLQPRMEQGMIKHCEIITTPEVPSGHRVQELADPNSEEQGASD